MHRPPKTKSSPVDLVRDAAIDVLLRVYDERGMHLDRSLDKTLRRKELGERGRRFLTHLVYGTVRNTILLDHALRPLCTQPLEKLPLPILCVLRMGVFQSLFSTQVTQPAMVHTSVDLAKRRGHAGLARMANAILRKAPQSLDEMRLPDRDKDLARFLNVRYSIPKWLCERWIKELGPERAEACCAVGNETAPTALRVNTLKTNIDELREHLEKSGCPVEKRTAIPEELTFVGEGAPLKTKWFQEGHFILQDPASMLPAHLLEPRDGDWVLDLCAAPGGKTTHLAQLAPGARIVAMDVEARRLNAVRENVGRLEVAMPMLAAANGVQPPLTRRFDRVLCDAPCSGLGTLRRHPDLKLRIQPETIKRLAALQRDLLRSAIRLCENGGVVVYSVCTFTPEETTGVIRDIVAEGEVETEAGPEFLNSWQSAAGQYQIDPTNPALDAFFLTRLRKRS